MTSYWQTEVENPHRPSFDSWVGKIPWRRDSLQTPLIVGFPDAQTVKNLPAVQETWVQSLHWKDPLEEGMATHSSILAYMYTYESCSVVSNSMTPWTTQSMEFSRPEYWSEYTKISLIWSFNLLIRMPVTKNTNIILCWFFWKKGKNKHADGKGFQNEN